VISALRLSTISVAAGAGVAEATVRPSAGERAEVSLLSVQELVSTRLTVTRPATAESVVSLSRAPVTAVPAGTTNFR
jgi:hypothetical protein